MPKVRRLLKTRREDPWTLLNDMEIIDDQSVSVRSKIARELVSNSLVHREYTSAYPAKIIIERDRIVTENWSIPKKPGAIDPDYFTPYPKNPLLANFFVQIGRADTLGSGVRNLYKFTKIYSDEEPKLIDGDVFKTIVPLDISLIKMSDNDKTSDKTSDNDKTHKEKVSEYLEKYGSINAQTASHLLNRAPATARKLLSEMISDGILVRQGANRNRTYKLINGK